MEKQENGVKMTLRDYYENLPTAIAPKTEFVKKIMDKCGVTQQATHRWLKKGSMPSSKEHCDAIAEIAGVAPEILFPLYAEKFSTNE